MDIAGEEKNGNIKKRVREEDLDDLAGYSDNPKGTNRVSTNGGTPDSAVIAGTKRHGKGKGYPKGTSLV